MKQLFIWVLWGVVIIGVCIAGDQLLLRYSMDSPVYGAAQTFYKDFRGRLAQLLHKEDHRIKELKESWPPALAAEVKEKMAPLLHSQTESTGYVYSDKEGGLHLTSTLNEVPKEYRPSAKPLQK